MSDENVGGLVAKWREAAKQADAAQGKVTKYGCAYAVVFRGCADELEAALSAHGQPPPRVTQEMANSLHETAQLLDEVDRRSEARREKYGLHGQPVVDEAMEKRAIKAFWPAWNEKRLRGDYRQPGAFALGMRAALTAALTGHAP